MSRAIILALVQSLSNQQATAAAIDRYYDDVVRDLGQRPWLTEASLVAVTANTSQYTLDTSVIRVLDMYYDDHVVRMSDLREMESINPRWRDETGTPISYIVEDETAKVFRLYKNPDRTSKDFSFIFGSPLGLDYPEYSVAIVHTQTRETLPDWLNLPVAFEILHREFMRESNHKDLEFSKVCKQLAQLFFTIFP